MGRQHAKVSSPDVATFIGFAAQAKLDHFMSAGAYRHHKLRFGFNPGGATGTHAINVRSTGV